MSGWMIEAAYKYAKVAELALQDGNLGAQSEVNAALAVEILLKSLLAEPVENQMSGTVAQQFEIKGKRRHGLYGLYEDIPDELRKKLDLDSHASTFEEKDSVLTVQRYEYEPSAKGTFDDTLLHLAAELIPKLVDHFLELGSTDSWLQFYRANPRYFALPTGIAIFGVYRGEVGGL